MLSSSFQFLPTVLIEEQFFKTNCDQQVGLDGIHPVMLRELFKSAVTVCERPDLIERLFRCVIGER